MLMVMVDRLTKRVHEAATKKTAGAEEIWRLFMINIVRLHGLPLEIVSDRDPRMTATYFRKRCEVMGIRQAMTTAGCPQADGQTERASRTLNDIMRTLSATLDWQDRLPFVEFTMNAARSDTQAIPHLKLILVSDRATNST
jgi:putative transposase